MNPKLKISFIAFVVICFVLPISGFHPTVPANDSAEKIESLVKYYYEQGDFSGAVLVSENGKIIYEAGLGLANKAWNIPNSVDTKFRLGSLTKQFTAMLVLQLVEEGQLSLKGSVSDYIPEYPKLQGEKVTIHHLLSHTSGMVHYDGIPNFFDNPGRLLYKPEEFMRLFWNKDLLFEPGSQFSYSSLGYYLLGVILERVTTKTYATLLQEKIFTPLGMKNSVLDGDLSIIKNRANGYRRTITGHENASYRDMSTAYATGGILSTVQDLYLWDQAHYTDQLLSKEYRNLLFKPNLANYGYGWIVQSYPYTETETTTLVGHSGSINGFNSLIYRFPEDNHMIVMLMNMRDAGNLRDIMRRITSILYQQPFDYPKKPAAREVALVSLDSGVTAALERYQTLKEDHAEMYSFEEDDFNDIGYDLLEMEKYQEAIAIFKINVEAYPTSSNTYNSLGQAYLRSRKLELAIKSYQLSLDAITDDPGLDDHGKAFMLRDARDMLDHIEKMMNKQE